MHTLIAHTHITFHQDDTSRLIVLEGVSYGSFLVASSAFILLSECDLGIVSHLRLQKILEANPAKPPGLADCYLTVMCSGQR